MKNMESIKITKTGAYFPEIMMENAEIEKKLNLETGYIQKRTGIQQDIIQMRCQKKWQEN